MPTLQELYDDPRFSNVNPQTKRDIIGAIDIDVNGAKSEFTEQQLTQALHYLLAKKAKTHPEVAKLLVRENSSAQASSHVYIGSPFYFRNNDPFLWYWVGYNSNSGGGWFGGGGGSGGNNCSGEAIAIAMAAACVCAAGCCCAVCMHTTATGPESIEIKTAKISGSTLTGAAVFIFLTYYLIQNEVWRSELVENHDWDVRGYRVFLGLIAAFGGLLASGTVSTINNLWQCFPDNTKPSPEILAALKELSAVDRLLTQGWSPREGDNAEESNAFVREVILAHIRSMACPEIRIGVSASAPPPASPSSSRFASFSQPLLMGAPASQLMPAQSSGVIPSAPDVDESHYTLLPPDDEPGAHRQNR